MRKALLSIVCFIFTLNFTFGYDIESMFNEYMDNNGYIQYNGEVMRSSVYSDDNVYMSSGMFAESIGYKITESDIKMKEKINNILSEVFKTSKGKSQINKLVQQTSALIIKIADGEVKMQNKKIYLIYEIFITSVLLIEKQGLEDFIVKVDSDIEESMKYISYKIQCSHSNTSSIPIDSLNISNESKELLKNVEALTSHIPQEKKDKFRYDAKLKKEKECSKIRWDIQKGIIYDGMSSSAFGSINEKISYSYKRQIESDLGDYYCMDNKKYKECLWVTKGIVGNITKYYH